MTTARTPGCSRTLLSGVFVVLAALAMTPDAYAAITVLAGDCSTPKTTFNLGETVCARVDGLVRYRLAWIDPDGFVMDRADVTSDPQLESFALPGTPQSSIGGVFIANNLGTWRATAITSRNSAQSSAFFTVRDPANVRVDLAVVNDAAGGEQPLAGGTVRYDVILLNHGPDDAANAHFLYSSVSNATFNSLRQTSGPAFTCTGTDCTIASFPAGAVAEFQLDFTAGSAGGILESTATFTSDTVELRPADNATPAPRLRVVATGTAPTCNLGCSGNLVVSANTTNNGAPGAIVNLAEPEAFGTCGPVTLSPASGSFFPLGVTTVTATASGGGLCSFTVSVVETPPPTISCPSDILTAAPSGEAEAFVPDPSGAGSNPGTATATGSNVSVIGERSDDRPLSDRYPIGMTPISWRATDDGGRIATCVQRITVTSPDAPTIQCPGDKNFRAPSGACAITVRAEDIGLPVTTGLGVAVTSRRSDDLALTDPFPAGTTFITWTAKNQIGLVSCIQTIRVLTDDHQAPVLSIPPDVTTFTSSCSAILDDELGVATADDNCGVTITRSGIPPHFVFPVGLTNVTYTATDAAGNSTSAVQRVRVLESPAVRPSITPPADVVARTGAAATVCGVVVSDTTLGTATATDNCPGVSVTRQGVPADNFFPVGETLVRHVATDASGNTATATQKVTVLDTTPPAISCPPNLTLEPSCPAGAVARWTAPVGTDNCTGAATSQTAGPANGSVFPIGTTTVSYTVADAAGNAASCSFTVQVLSVAATIGRLKTAVDASSLQPPTRQGLLPKLDSALSAIERGNASQACQMIRNFSNSAQNYIDHGDLAADVGQPWLATAVRLINALGCTNEPCS